MIMGWPSVNPFFRNICLSQKEQRFFWYSIFIQMLIIGGLGLVMLVDDGSYPDIVLGDWLTFSNNLALVMG